MVTFQSVIIFYPLGIMLSSPTNQPAAKWKHSIKKQQLRLCRNWISTSRKTAHLIFLSTFVDILILLSLSGLIATSLKWFVEAGVNSPERLGSMFVSIAAIFAVKSFFRRMRSDRGLVTESLVTSYFYLPQRQKNKIWAETNAVIAEGREILSEIVRHDTTVNQTPLIKGFLDDYLAQDQTSFYHWEVIEGLVIYGMLISSDFNARRHSESIALLSSIEHNISDAHEQFAALKKH